MFVSPSYHISLEREAVFTEIESLNFDWRILWQPIIEQTCISNHSFHGFHTYVCIISWRPV